MNLINVASGISASGVNSNQKASVKKADKGSEDGKYAVERAEPSSLKSTIIDTALGILLFPLGISGCTDNSQPGPIPSKVKTPYQLTQAEHGALMAIYASIYKQIGQGLPLSPGTQLSIFERTFTDDPETHQQLPAPFVTIGVTIPVNFSDSDLKILRSNIHGILDQRAVAIAESLDAGVISAKNSYVFWERTTNNGRPEVQLYIFPREIDIKYPKEFYLR